MNKKKTLKPASDVVRALRRELRLLRRALSREQKRSRLRAGPAEAERRQLGSE